MKDFASLIANHRWTELLDEIPSDRIIPLNFPDCRAMESFKAMAVLSNRRGERDVYFSVRMDYRQKILTVISKRIEDGRSKDNRSDS